MEKVLGITGMDKIISIFGEYDKNINVIKKEFGVSVLSRDNMIKIIGDEPAVLRAEKAILSLEKILESGEEIGDVNLGYAIDMAKDNMDDAVLYGKDCILITAKGKPLKSKTLGQKQYVEAIEKNTITFGIGPAGTGKTYLAVAMAVKAFKAGQISRIILIRPAVEAGEKLGFLPGDLQNKVDPYLRPLYDGLFDMIGPETFQKLMEKGVIEVAPLAYMRGRTLDDSFIILDEAQNTTKEQMKMFLTRMGNGSKIVVTGDVTQIDLPADKKSGLKDAISILKNIDDIAIIRLTEKDVVRHKLVQDIVRAYEKAANEKPSFTPPANKRGRLKYVK